MMKEAAARGQFALQCCVACGHVQYPPREMCEACLDGALEWREAAARPGVLLADTELHHSNEAAFRPLLPLRCGLVKLQAGPVVVAFIEGKAVAEQSVAVRARLDEAGRAVLVAAA